MWMYICISDKIKNISPHVDALFVDNSKGLCKQSVNIKA